MMFTEIPDSDCDDKFHKKRDNSRGNRRKKGISSPLAPIFKRKTKKKRRTRHMGRKVREVQMTEMEVELERLWPPPLAARSKASVKTAQPQGYW